MGKGVVGVVHQLEHFPVEGHVVHVVLGYFIDIPARQNQRQQGQHQHHQVDQQERVSKVFRVHQITVVALRGVGRLHRGKRRKVIVQLHTPVHTVEVFLAVQLTVIIVFIKGFEDEGVGCERKG